MDIRKKPGFREGILSKFLNRSGHISRTVSGISSGGGDSSEEDGSVMGSSTTDDDDSIANPQKGVIVFLDVYCFRTRGSKTLHINLYNGYISQFSGRRSKKFQCSTIQMVMVSSDIVSIDIKKPKYMNVKQKKYRFDSATSAKIFKTYVDCYNLNGVSIRTSFDAIEKKGTRLVKFGTLSAGLSSYDIEATDSQVAVMLNINGSNEDYFHFEDYFNIFMGEGVCSARDCLELWLHKSLSEESTKRNSLLLNNMVSFHGDRENVIESMPGEEILDVLENAHWSYCTAKTIHPTTYIGYVVITNYRIAMVTYRFKLSMSFPYSRYERPRFFELLSVPLYTCTRIQSAPPGVILLSTKDNRNLRIQLSPNECYNTAKLDGLMSIILREAYGTANHTACAHVFAYKYHGTFMTNGWIYADIRREYSRQDLTGNAWQLIDNSDWSLVPTYPQFLVVPAAMNKQELDQCIKHRSKNRFPVITYRHAKTGAVLTRSAQPLVGLSQHSSTADATLLNLYRCKGVSQSDQQVPGFLGENEDNAKFYIFDARRQIAATLNMAQGKGTESASNYQNAELIFCDIDNIHVMRVSYTILGDLLQPGGGITGIQNENGGAGYLTKIEESGWLRHLRLILIASYRIAEKMHLEGASVLVHCSDGWDRTAQLCSLVQILLDPFYRTFEGIASLVEKEWCSFGFKFNERCGHGEDYMHQKDERSPVFVQFLDALYQVMRQFPTSFQYSEQLLVFLGDHVYSCLFGTFLGNSDRERNEEMYVADSTQSIWSYVFEFPERFANKEYEEYNRPIWPSCQLSKLVLWERFHLRWDPECHPASITGQAWHDDWGMGFETVLTKGLQSAKSCESLADALEKELANTSRDFESSNMISSTPRLSSIVEDEVLQKLTERESEC